MNSTPKQPQDISKIEEIQICDRKQQRLEYFPLHVKLIAVKLIRMN